MNLTIINPLAYRRQYIITPEEICCPFLCNKIRLGDSFILYAHQDIVVTECVNSNVRIWLLGDMFDYELKHIKSNRDILNELLELSFNDLTEKLARYTGRFVMIYQNGNNLKLLHDATATKKIYYANIHGQFWFASQSFLLGKMLNLEKTTLPSKLAYYNSSDFILSNMANVGDMTIFDEIRQVMPNHYFDVNQNRTIRYFPNKPIERMSMEDTIRKCAEMISGYMENIIERYDVMLPVTAGKDSRLLVAATKNRTDKVYYYINKRNDLTNSSNDIRIPKELLAKVGLDFHIVDPYIPVDEEFKKIYFENNPFASTKYLPMIFNYYSNFSNRVNLPGNIAFESYFIHRIHQNSLSPSSLADVCSVKKYQFAVDYFARYLDENRTLCERTNMNLLNLLYWEERLGNWRTQIQLDKDIAQDEINPFNSRMLSCLFLSIDYQLLDGPGYLFHKELIKYLWPELLQKPINPSHRTNIKHIMKRTGIFAVYCKLLNLLNNVN